MTPGEGVKAQSRRTSAGNELAKMLAPMLPDEYKQSETAQQQ
jgi:hypothetical protein